MKILSENIVFGIAGKWRVSTLAKKFIITFRICLVIGILPWIMLKLFLRDNARNIKKHKKIQKSCLWQAEAFRISDLPDPISG